MESLLAITRMATECIQAGRTADALLHLGMLEANLAKQQAVGLVGEVPVLGGGIGYLNVPLPLSTVLYAERG